MKKHPLIKIVLLLLLLSSCYQSQPTATPELIYPTATEPQCQLLFEEAIALTEAARENSDAIVVVDTLVKAGEYFLNNCVESDLPLSAQPDQLAELLLLAQVVPPSFRCGYRYTPTYELIDLDDNGVDELILHLQTVRCDHYFSAEHNVFGDGGLSIFFHWDLQARNWQGQVIWPAFYSGEGAWTLSPQPDVQVLEIKDSQDQFFMLVAGINSGADHMGVYLTVWRWRDYAFEVVLDTYLTNWCGTPNEWEITEDNAILIPAADATTRCSARDPVLYVLQGDEFVIQKP